MSVSRAAAESGSNLPATLPAAPEILAAALGDPSEQIRSKRAQLRQSLLSLLNAVAAEGQESAYPEDILALANNDLRSAISFIHTRKGVNGVRDHMQPNRLLEALAIGRKLRQTYLKDPLREIREKNTVLETRSLSGLVQCELDHSRGEPTIVSQTLWNALQAGGSCDSFPDYLQCRADIAKLSALLAIADTLQLTEDAIMKNIAPSMAESGIMSILNETNFTVSFLEIAVFKAVYAKRHSLRTQSPLVLPVAHARRFLAEYDAGSKLRAEARESYESACGKVFKNEKDAAWALLQHYLDELGEHVSSHYGSVHRIRNPEFIFPVERISKAAFAGGKKR